MGSVCAGDRKDAEQNVESPKKNKPANNEDNKEEKPVAVENEQEKVAEVKEEKPEAEEKADEEEKPAAADEKKEEAVNLDKREPEAAVEEAKPEEPAAEEEAKPAEEEAKPVEEEAKPEEPAAEEESKPAAEPVAEEEAEEAKPVAEPVAEKAEPEAEEAEPEAEAEKKPDPFFDLIMNECLAKNEFPLEQYEKILASDHQPMCVKHCSPELFEKLKDLESSGPAKWTMARTINSGIQNPTSFVGCHVGDMQSYDDFKEFWYPLIEEYHKGFVVEEPKREEISTAERFNVDRLPILSENARSRIVSTRIRCARNLADFPLNPGAPDVESRKAILGMLEGVYGNLPEDFQGKLHKHEVMSEEEREGLVKAHFLFRGKDVMQASSGYHQFWPVGRGIFVRNDQKFLNWINEGDHIRIISMEKGSDVKEVFARLGRGVELVEAGIREATGKGPDDPVFMFHPKLGSVTCCPSNLGSGLRGGVFLQIPNLLKERGFDAIDKLAREKFHCQIRGTGGEHSSPGAGGEVDVSNWRRIGFWEYELVTDMITCVNALADMEAALANGEAAAEEPAKEEAAEAEEEN